ncbi:hypothetical protein SBA3_330027 [Candidatus Sulfopaludibacter sp. SbA3]|nr:hypothetical protein SBA3_330027 [Candidatus Sulfopaludibacter sp. SbA3]
MLRGAVGEIQAHPRAFPCPIHTEVSCIEGHFLDGGAVLWTTPAIVAASKTGNANTWLLVRRRPRSTRLFSFRTGNAASVWDGGPVPSLVRGSCFHGVMARSQRNAVFPPPVSRRQRAGDCLGVLLDCLTESPQADIPWWDGAGYAMGWHELCVQSGTPASENRARALDRRSNREIVAHQRCTEHWTGMESGDPCVTMDRRLKGPAPPEGPEESPCRAGLPIVHGARGVPYHAYSAGELAELHARVRVVASPRNPEQDALIAKYCILAKKGGNQVGRKHPDRIRFRYRSDVGAVRPRWDEPEDEIQTAYLALVEALTPSAGRKAYTELPGVHFSVPLKKRIEGAINDLIRHDCQGVLTEITCEPCAGSACPMCLGTGKRAHRQRLEIDEPTPESPEAEEDDERLNLSWNQPGREPDPERLLLSRERSERTKTAISLLGRGVQKLRHEYATVILGLFYNDETQDQIAEKLGVHRSSVSRYKDDALACLRFVVEPYRDGRSLGYSPSSSPPRQTGGAFSLGGRVVALLLYRLVFQC